MRGVYHDVAAESAAVLSGKLEQVACGFLYDGRGDVLRLDRGKATLCAKLVREAVRRSGSVIVCYQFEADLEGLGEAGVEGVVLSEVKATGLDSVVRRWNAGEIPVLLVHPRSGGHGLNVAQGGCEMVWHTLPWSRDLYMQTVARLWRRGQTRTVRVTRIETAGSIDVVKWARLKGKAEWERLFDEHLAG